MPGAIIALGANLGDTEASIKAAAQEIEQLAGVSVTAVSTIIRSEPAYRSDQPEFANAVMAVQVSAGVTPHELLHKLQAIEQNHGRDRSGNASVNGPRTLDLDIVDFEGVVSDDPELLLPHPLALERDFVVNPLLEIAPNYVLANGEPVVLDTSTLGGAVFTGAALNGAASSALSALSAFSTPSTQSASSDNASDSSTPGRDALGAAGLKGTPGTPGTLFICSTPIGNLGDITLRVVETLGAVDAVLAEDTRVARRLLSHLNLRPELQRCDENVIRSQTPVIIQRLQAGQHLAYLSDAGTPGVCDPGMHLVAAVCAAGLNVEVLPGASALLTALVAAGFEASSFYFGGFLPRKTQQRQSALAALAALDAVLVFYESPHRTPASLQDIATVFPQREVALCRELTKLHEEVLRAPAVELAAQIAARDSLKGEVVLLVAPPAAPPKRKHQDKYAANPSPE